MDSSYRLQRRSPLFVVMLCCAFRNENPCLAIEIAPNLSSAVRLSTDGAVGTVISVSESHNLSDMLMPTFISVDVERALYGTHILTTTPTRFKLGLYSWPLGVRQPTKGEAFFFLLQKSQNGDGVLTIVCAIPTDKGFAPIDRDKEAIAKAAVRKQLAGTSTSMELRALLLLSADLWNSNDLSTIRPLKASADLSVSRAAMGVILRLSPSRKKLAFVRRDVARSLKGHVKERTAERTGTGAASGPTYIGVLESYGVLASVPMDSKLHKMLLPVHRLIARNLEHGDRYWWTAGVLPLVSHGEWKDLELLADCHEKCRDERSKDTVCGAILNIIHLRSNK